jgi:hypothetical protein
MKILQGSNGKIQFWAAGKIQFSCLPSQNYRVMDNNEIHLISAGVKVLSIFADEITDIQILGGAVTPTTFNNSQELAESLDSNFFFDVSGTSNIFDYFGETGEYAQTQTLNLVLANSTVHLTANQYAIPIFLNGTYNEFSLHKLASGFTGNMAYGIYDSRTTGAAYPNNLIWESGNKVLTVASELVQSLVAPAITFTPGMYWFSWAADAAFTWRGTAATLNVIGLDLSGVPALSNIARIFSIVAFTGTLAPIWVAPIINSLAGTPPLLLQKKVI